MVYKCCVPMCKSGYLSNKEKVSIFQIPATKIDLYNQIIKLPDRKLTLKDHVCEKHFAEKFIRRDDLSKLPLGKPRLTSDAVPTIFPGRTISTNKSTDNDKKGNEPLSINPAGAIVAPSKKRAIDKPPDIFINIWLKKLAIKLPQPSWAISCVSKGGLRFITFLQTVLTNDDNIPVVERKLVMGRDLYLKLYIGFVPVKRLPGIPAEFPLKCASLPELEFYLQTFDSVVLCKGGPLVVSYPSIQMKDVEIDLAAERWRNKKCDYTVSEGIQCQPCQTITNRLKQRNSRKANKRKPHEPLSFLQRTHRRIRSQEFRLKRSILESEERLKGLQERSKELLITQVSQLNLPSLQKQLIEESIRMPESNSENPKCFSEDWLLTCTLLSNCNPDAYSFMWKSGLLPLPSPEMIRKSGNSILAIRHPPQMVLNLDEIDISD